MTASLTHAPGAPIERTEHPHIVKSAGTLGGEPRVEGTRLAVRHILGWIENGATVEDVVRDHPPLTPAQVHDALNYAYDHPDEIAAHREQNRLRTVLKELDYALVGDRFVPREQLASIEVPPGVPVYTWETLPPQPDD